jgi:hypothetical protein
VSEGGPPAVRASDADREEAITALREHCAAGRLTLEEFSARADEAYAATTVEELERVQRELPLAVPPSRRRPIRFTLSVFGRVIRRGRWRLRRRTAVLSALGDVDLDLRQAAIEEPESTIRVLALFGNADVYVPEGVEVEVHSVVLFGHCREWGRDEPRRGSPLVRVHVLTLFGTADVWRVPPGFAGSYRDVIRHLRDRQRELPV